MLFSSPETGWKCFCVIMNVAVGKNKTWPLGRLLFWISRFQKATMNQTNIEQALVSWLCRPGCDSTFDLFQPFYSASWSSNSTQTQLGHNNGSKLMQQWMKSSSVFHFQLRRAWWSKWDGANKGSLGVFSTADCRVIKSSPALTKTTRVSVHCIESSLFFLNSFFVCVAICHKNKKKS